MRVKINGPENGVSWRD